MPVSSTFTRIRDSHFNFQHLPPCAPKYKQMMEPQLKISRMNHYSAHLAMLNPAEDGLSTTLLAHDLH